MNSGETEKYQHPLYHYYCDENGDIYNSINNRLKKVTIWKSSKNYSKKKLVISHEGKRVVYWAHRFCYECYHNILLLYTSTQSMTVDHINFNPLDNRKENLQLIPFSENNKKRKPK